LIEVRQARDASEPDSNGIRSALDRLSAAPGSIIKIVHAACIDDVPGLFLTIERPEPAADRVRHSARNRVHLGLVTRLATAGDGMDPKAVATQCGAWDESWRWSIRPKAAGSSISIPP
jgi:hypothetical protein